MHLHCYPMDRLHIIFFNEEYKGTNPQSAHNNLVKDWNSAKDYAYKNGKAKDGWSRHKHMSSFYAVVTSEANVQWWVIRTNLFKSGDNNVFADKAAQKATRKKCKQYADGSSK